jgi:hypothetical protein
MQKMKTRKNFVPPKDEEGSEKIENISGQPDQKLDVPISALTPDESALRHRIENEREDWKTIGEDSAHDYTLSEDPMKLPDAAIEAEKDKQFKFRWIERNPRRLDIERSKQVPFKWWICNASNTPFLLESIDPVLGCVCKLDQMLLFKPWWMHERESQIRLAKTDAYTHGDLLSKHGEKREWGEFTAFKGDEDAGNQGAARAKLGGGDVIYADEAAIDRDMGIHTPAVQEADMQISE